MAAVTTSIFCAEPMVERSDEYVVVHFGDDASIHLYPDSAEALSAAIRSALEPVDVSP